MTVYEPTENEIRTEWERIRAEWSGETRRARQVVAAVPWVVPGVDRYAAMTTERMLDG